MPRIQILRKLVLQLVGASLLGIASGLLAGQRPNVLFIVVDDLRPELGCFGAADVRSPNIDRLAERGLRFDRAYCQVAVCNPSRISALTGCRPDTTGVFDNQHGFRATLPGVVTLPQHFLNNGYTCLSLGKVFHHSEREPWDDPQSWSEPAWYHGEPYRHWFTAESEDFVKRLKALPSGKRPKLIRAAPFEAADEPDDVYPDGRVAAKAIETLGRLAAGERPFFLAVGFVKPHLPFTCPQKYWDLYPPETIRLPDNFRSPENVPAPALHNNYELRSYGTVPPSGDIAPEMARRLIRGYRACVSYMDAQAGLVLAELDRLKLRDNTIVIFWGDNGYHLGEYGLFTKMTNFELGARVPLIVSVPRPATAGKVCRGLVELVDLYPTLSELCGLPAPAHLEGASFVPLLSRPEQAWKTAAFSQYVRPGRERFIGRSIRTDRWRYTEWIDANGRSAGNELYDHESDPAENRNLAAVPAHQTLVTELSQQLQAGWKLALPAHP